MIARLKEVCDEYSIRFIHDTEYPIDDTILYSYKRKLMIASRGLKHRTITTAINYIIEKATESKGGVVLE